MNPLEARLAALEAEVEVLRRAAPQLLSIAAACALLGCSRPTFWRWRRAGLIRPAGGTPYSPRFRRQDVEKLMQTIINY